MQNIRFFLFIPVKSVAPTDMAHCGNLLTDKGNAVC